jgi:hypothetical protein
MIPVFIGKDFAIVLVEVFSYSAGALPALIQIRGQWSIPTTTPAEPSRPLFRFHENQLSFVNKVHRHTWADPLGRSSPDTHSRKARGVMIG